MKRKCKIYRQWVAAMEEYQYPKDDNEYFIIGFTHKANITTQCLAILEHPVDKTIITEPIDHIEMID